MKRIKISGSLLLLSLLVATLLQPHPIGANSLSEQPSNLADTLQREVIESDSIALESADVDPEPSVSKPDQMPSFKGGSLVKFNRWIAQRVRYPKEAYSRGIEGIVTVFFVVEADGTIKEEHIQILKSPDPSLSNEVYRLLTSAPKWEPAIHNGRNVRVAFTIPVVFNIPRPSSNGRNHFPERNAPTFHNNDRSHSSYRRNSF